MTRAQKLAVQRINFARERLGQLRPEQRKELTADRIIASYGVTPMEAAYLLNQYGWRA